jgi:Cu+-exporting ATPase
MSDTKIVEVPIQGMDCVECTQHVKGALADLPGVDSVDVYLAAEKAVLRLDSELVDMGTIRKAVLAAGYSVPEVEDDTSLDSPLQEFTRPILTFLGIVFALVLFVVIVGEWLGLFEAITGRVPWPVSLVIVLVAGFPVFRSVFRATLQRQVIAHTLMTVGVIAAMLAGEWATAIVVVFFMRVGDYVERFTTDRARRALKDLTTMAPQTARLVRDAGEVEVPISEVQLGDIIVVRPGEKIPVDGQVIYGHATVDQAAITGESMPIEAGPGARVYAATLISVGSLRVRTDHVGPDTTFGKVIKLVEQAEAQRAVVQRVADRFSAYYLPVVAAVAALTFLIRRDPMATVAVLVVACSCAFALATPIAMLASIGAGAKRGFMIKGGKYLELLAEADVLLIDKTGTLTLGKPRVTDVLTFNLSPNSQPLTSNLPSLISNSQYALLHLASSAERYSEHPLAEAVRAAARDGGLDLSEPDGFESYPGVGVRANVDGHEVTVGNRRILDVGSIDQNPSSLERAVSLACELEAAGKTIIFVLVDDRLAGLLAAADIQRPEVPQAIDEILNLGIKTIELLTGDNQNTAAALAEQLDIPYRAELLPEDKIKVVADYQAAGHCVVMVGDGVNDAPALAQADVGIAMGAVGSDVAVEAAHIALMREDWSLVPEVIRIARSTMRVVKMNIAFTAIYNIAGLTLAAFGYLPPILAAAAQSIPDLGILANSSRLLRGK